MESGVKLRKIRSKGYISNGIEFENIGNLPINTININTEKVETNEKKLAYRIVKRTFDIFCGLLGCVFLIPVVLAVKISYLITGDTKSIYYTQSRVGKSGKMFKLYKFRSMVYNADEILEKLLEDPKYKKEWDENQKFDNDPRITKMGNILRKTSLDELPQIINVLKGDMSFIGPRPLVPGELNSHNGNHVLYESVRPGISGWWASHGRSATTYEERLELEYYYCNNCSLWLDVKCLFATIKAVLFKTGAK